MGPLTQGVGFGGCGLGKRVVSYGLGFRGGEASLLGTMGGLAVFGCVHDNAGGGRSKVVEAISVVVRVEIRAVGISGVVVVYKRSM